MNRSRSGRPWRENYKQGRRFHLVTSLEQFSRKSMMKLLFSSFLFVSYIYPFSKPLLYPSLYLANEYGLNICNREKDLLVRLKRPFDT